MAVVSKDDVRRRLIEALAADRQRDPGELEAELLQAGPECPVDSIRLVWAGLRVARELGLTIKPSTQIAHFFKSIDALAGFLSALAQGTEAA